MTECAETAKLKIMNHKYTQSKISYCMSNIFLELIWFTEATDFLNSSLSKIIGYGLDKWDLILCKSKYQLFNAIQLAACPPRKR
jgi:hypothetical protein